MAEVKYAVHTNLFLTSGDLQKIGMVSYQSLNNVSTYGSYEYRACKDGVALIRAALKRSAKTASLTCIFRKMTIEKDAA
jgi:hypothetical protein